MNSSRINARLLKEIQNQKNITVHQLHKEYDDFKIDVPREQKLLVEHENIVLQFPFCWYSTPALLKQWLDNVLSHGFSHGKGGDKLHGKKLQLAISTAYSVKHYNPIMFKTHPKLEPLQDLPTPYLKSSIAIENEKDTMGALLKPLEQTAYYIGMDYQKPFIIHSASPLGQNSHAISEEELDKRAKEYLDLINSL